MLQLGAYVSLSDTEPVDIPEQNFGFDIVNGKTSVDISIENDHYSMKVRKNVNRQGLKTGDTHTAEQNHTKLYYIFWGRE